MKLHPKKTSYSYDLNALSKALFFVWWILGVSFLAVSTVFFRGGGAIEGKVQRGHYFVAKGSTLFEVSRLAFIYGYAHEFLWFIVSLVLAVLYIAVALQRQDLLWLKLNK